MSVFGSIILNGPFLVIYGLGIWIAHVRLAKRSAKRLVLVIGCLLGLLNRVSAGVFYPLSTHMMVTGELESDSYVRWISSWGVGATVCEAVSVSLLIAAAVMRSKNPENEIA